jgi:CubicO group peptidase (beta-lactamase class C family)
LSQNSFTSNAAARHLFPARSYERQDAIFFRAFTILQDAIASHAFPGASVAVTHKNSLMALKSFGRFTYEPDSPNVTDTTIFDLASVSKVVATTSMAMILYERGLLDLNSPVIAVVPEFAGDRQAEDSHRKNVTIRMLLAHSAGLAAYEKLFQHANTREGLLNAAFSAPLIATPGSKAEYSDIGFIILGIVLERIADESISQFCQREVFGPIGMSHTTFNPPPEGKYSIAPTANDQAFRQRIIQGEVNDENASVLGGVAGQAGVFSTADDIARFANVIVQRGLPLVRPETLKVFARRESAPPGTSRALGWDTPSQPSQSGKYFSPGSFGHVDRSAT